MTAAVSTSAPAAKASGSSFYAAMRLMPKAERDAMYAIYAFCRAVDDIADDPGPRGPRRQALNAWRAAIDSLYEGRPAGLSRFLAPIVTRYGLRREDFHDVIDGMQMDLDTDIRAPDVAVLDVYCDRVASAVGRLSIKVFGMDEGPGFALAHHLGRALQLTNILRDLDEDAGIGRLYLPREYLQSAGVVSEDPKTVLADPQVDAVARAVAFRAHTHYREADAILSARPKGNLRAPRLMEKVYARILSAMEREGWKAPRRRVRIAKPVLLWIVARHGLFG